MPFLSPEKLLIVLVVALVILGPDKLPGFARQISTTWRAVKSLRARLEEEARSLFPEMPPLDHLSQAVRSPLSYLDRLVTEQRPSGETDPAALADADATPGLELTESQPPHSGARPDPIVN